MKMKIVKLIILAFLMFLLYSCVAVKYYRYNEKTGRYECVCDTADYFYGNKPNKVY